MQQSFRARYEQRGRTLELMGEPVDKLSREELFAVIGYLLEASGDLQDRLADHRPLGSPRGADDSKDDPPKNDGLYEG